MRSLHRAGMVFASRLQIKRVERLIDHDGVFAITPRSHHSCRDIARAGPHRDADRRCSIGIFGSHGSQQYPGPSHSSCRSQSLRKGAETTCLVMQRIQQALLPMRTSHLRRESIADSTGMEFALTYTEMKTINAPTAPPKSGWLHRRVAISPSWRPHIRGTPVVESSGAVRLGNPIEIEST